MVREPGQTPYVRRPRTLVDLRVLQIDRDVFANRDPAPLQIRGTRLGVPALHGGAPSRLGMHPGAALVVNADRVALDGPDTFLVNVAGAACETRRPDPGGVPEHPSRSRVLLARGTEGLVQPGGRDLGRLLAHLLVLRDLFAGELHLHHVGAP